MFNQAMDNVLIQGMANNRPYMSDTARFKPNYYADGGIVQGEEDALLMEDMAGMEDVASMEDMALQQENKPYENNNPYPSLAEMIRQQGGEEDTVLAHINPIEAEMLGVLANGGKINPVTGLPQFGWGLPRIISNPFKTIEKAFKNPGHTAKRFVGKTVLPVGGAILGNMMLPGVGGIAGGALGGGFGEIAIGGKFGQGALSGGMMGLAAPTVAGLVGKGATALGAQGMGSALSNYGATNAILPSIGLGAMGAATPEALYSSPVSEIVKKEALETAAKEAAKMSFTDTLMAKSGEYLSDPKNLLTMGVLGGALMNRPKAPREKSPEEQATERKRYELGLMLTPEELAKKEAADTALEQSKRRVSRNKFLPEERFNIEPMYVKTNSPEEYKNKKRWLEYYNNPEFSGNPLTMKAGGHANVSDVLEIEQINPSSGLGFYINGDTSGQDDEIPAMLSDGEFVIPADCVAHLGDGNNNAGAKKLDIMIEKIRSSKGAKKKLPPKARSLTKYISLAV
jgi:hypothetical protein